MNDDSVDVWAQAKMKFPDLTTFSICTWVKFTYEASTVIAVFDASLQLGLLCFCSRTKYMIPDNKSRSYLVAALQ